MWVLQTHRKKQPSWLDIQQVITYLTNAFPSPLWHINLFQAISVLKACFKMYWKTRAMKSQLMTTRNTVCNWVCVLILKQKTTWDIFSSCSSHLLFTPVIASSPHVFTSFSSALWWHHCLTHSDTYTVLLKLPSRAFGWGLVFVVDRIAVINVPSPDPSCSLRPRPSLRRSSWANPTVCVGLRCTFFVCTCVLQWMFGRQ